MNQKEMAKYFNVSTHAIHHAVHGNGKIKRDVVLCRKKRPARFKKLNVWLIRAIRELRAEGKSLTELAQMFNVDKSYISNIARKKKFAHIK